MNKTDTSKTEREGIVCVWQGFLAETDVQVFDGFHTKQIKKVSVGDDHYAFLTTDGEVFTVGNNEHGQLGIGVSDKSKATPCLVKMLSDKEIIDVCCGTYHSAAITVAGSVYCWGDSSHGQCGTGRLDKVFYPELLTFSPVGNICQHGMPVPDDRVRILKVACGRAHSMAISEQAELWVWGSGIQLGLPGQLEALTPVQITMQNCVLDIACGDLHSIALVEKNNNNTPYGDTPKKSATDLRFHKYFPPTCAKCNEEIYSYIETDDICIITDEHTCADTNQEIAGERLTADSFVSDLDIVKEENKILTRDKHGHTCTEADKQVEKHFSDVGAEGKAEFDIYIKDGNKYEMKQDSNKICENDGEREQNAEERCIKCGKEEANCRKQEEVNTFKINSSTRSQTNENTLNNNESIKCDGESLPENASLNINEILPNSVMEKAKDCKTDVAENVSAEKTNCFSARDEVDSCSYQRTLFSENDGIKMATNLTEVSDLDFVSNEKGREKVAQEDNFLEINNNSKMVREKSIAKLADVDCSVSTELESFLPKIISDGVTGCVNGVECEKEKEENDLDKQNKTKAVSHDMPGKEEKSSAVGTEFSSKSKSHLIDENEARRYLAKQLDDTKSDKTSSENLLKLKLENILTMVPNTQTMMQQMSNITNKAIHGFRTTLVDKFSFVSEQNLELENLSKSSSLDSNLQLDTDYLNMSRKTLIMADDTSSGDEMARQNFSSSEDIYYEEKSDSSPSLRTLWQKHKKLERERRSSKAYKDQTDLYKSESSIVLPCVETEIWTWGKNSKGQLGQGDMVDREKPSCIKMLISKNCIQVAAGAFHTLALTASSQVFSWGQNSSGQLGHREKSATPNLVLFVPTSLVWDIAAGTSHSIFLIDSGGFYPDVYYTGKHPSKTEAAFSSVTKTIRPVALTFLRKTGWIRSIKAGGNNCACLLDKNTSGHTATTFELAISERNFYHHLHQIVLKFFKPLKKSLIYTSQDVFPFKAALTTMVDTFIMLTAKVGVGSVELSRLLRDGKEITHSTMFQRHEELIGVFRKYSHKFADMLAVGGFQYCEKNGSVFFEKIQDVLFDLLEESKPEKVIYALAMQNLMQYPLRRLKEYGRLADKLAMGYPMDSDIQTLLSHIALNWNSLKLAFSCEHTVADNTRLFWEKCPQKLADTLRSPGRRMLRDSKVHSLVLPTAGRFSAHSFLLFNDIFVHVHSSSTLIYPLEIVWVETAGESDQQSNTITLVTPEDTYLLSAPTPSGKTEWVMALNQAINKVLHRERTIMRQDTTDRLTPPIVRHASYKFIKYGLFKDATYTGSLIKGRIQGHGEMKWPDGRVHIGKFKNGVQHGQGKYIIPKGKEEDVYQCLWKDGKINGLGNVRYASGDQYDGYFKDGQKFGHGVLRQGKHMASVASVYIGEWMLDKRNGYGVLDDVLKGEKYMGMWQDDQRHGSGIVVTLDGMYFEGKFVQGKLTGFGLMLTDDDSCYEGEFSGITQLHGRGTLKLPNGDYIEGHFSGSWNEGLKLNGTFHKKTSPAAQEKKCGHMLGIQSSTYGTLSVPADRKWEDIFSHCKALLGYSGEGKPDSGKAWEVVAVMISNGRKSLKDKELILSTSPSKMKMLSITLEELEKIPPYDQGKLTVEDYHQISDYLAKAFDTNFHPIGKLIEGLVDVFRAAYIGIGAHPRLLHHAIKEIKSVVMRIYQTVRILFHDLPSSGNPLRIYSESCSSSSHHSSPSENDQFLGDSPEDDESSEIITAAGLLYPLLLPKIYPPVFDLYALYNDKEDEKYWERVQKLNRQGDMALMAYLGIDQKFWLIEDNLFHSNRQKLSHIKDHCYVCAIEMLQQISTAFSPKEKLIVIQRTFLEITKAVQSTLGEEYIWCMDDLFPIFQYVVVRSKIRHLGAEIHLIDDLMESYLEYGELGIMFTTLKACYFQIQHEKIHS